jgi:HK97 family phage major capsid protein
MNKELQKLLKEINDKKNAVRSLANEGKIEEAKTAKQELVALQDKFNLLMDLDDDEGDDIEDAISSGRAKDITGGAADPKAKKKNLVKAFVNIVKCGFLKKEPEEADVTTYKNALTSDATPNEEGESGIGVVVPEDIRTDIIELRRSEDNLEQYVNVEHVTTKSGSRNIEVDADSVPFDNVDEEADFPGMDEPQFRKIKYEIKKKGGILKITAELFEDAAQNVMAYINKWIAKKTKATRNAMILKTINTMTTGKEVVISSIDSLKDVFNVKLEPAIALGAVVITNQNGFNYLDKLKDSDGKYILQPNPTQPTQMLLFGKYQIIKVSNKVIKSESITDETTKKVTGYKHPVYMGDLKEAVTLFDRNVITIDMNDKGAGLWEKDMTGIKVRDRFDVQPVDEAAVIKGNITETVQG